MAQEPGAKKKPVASESEATGLAARRGRLADQGYFDGYCLAAGQAHLGIHLDGVGLRTLQQLYPCRVQLDRVGVAVASLEAVGNAPDFGRDVAQRYITLAIAHLALELIPGLWPFPTVADFVTTETTGTGFGNVVVVVGTVVVVVVVGATAPGPVTLPTMVMTSVLLETLGLMTSWAVMVARRRS